MSGPLAPFVAAYRAELRELGYTPLGMVKQLRQVAALSRWLAEGGIEPAELSSGVLARFLEARDWAEPITASAPGMVAMLTVEDDPIRRTG